MDNPLIEPVIDLCWRAGEAILHVYAAPEALNVSAKADNSPVTAADLAAHAILAPGLAALLPGVPVLSEEGDLPGFDERRRWSRYWLIDPLDGTKEFIRRNGEFTVNVALIDNGVPVLGVVFVPVLDMTYIGDLGVGAWKIDNRGRRAIQVRTIDSRLSANLPVEVVSSRRHGGEAVVPVIDAVTAALGRVATKTMGSSLKLCLIAEGQADLYPRLAPTAEWDTAAAQAVVEAAGGQVVDANFKPLRYNTKDSLLNPFFHVLGDPSFDWEKLLKDLD